MQDWGKSKVKADHMELRARYKTWIDPVLDLPSDLEEMSTKSQEKGKGPMGQYRRLYSSSDFRGRSHGARPR